MIANPFVNMEYICVTADQNIKCDDDVKIIQNIKSDDITIIQNINRDDEINDIEKNDMKK